MPKPRGRIFADTHCVVCTALVSHERFKYKRVTCSDECQRIRAATLRARQDHRECRYCRKPSTPKERAAFALFRVLEAQRPDLVYPKDFAAWSKASPELPPHQLIEQFAQHWNEAKAAEVATMEAEPEQAPA